MTNFIKQGLLLDPSLPAVQDPTVDSYSPSVSPPTSFLDVTLFKRYFINSVVAQKRRRKWKKIMMKTKKQTNNVEDSLLENAWEAAMSRSTVEDDRFARAHSKIGSGSVVPMDTRSVASMDMESVSVETGSIVGTHSLAGTMMDPPGSVASSNLRGSTSGNRSQYRGQQKNNRR
jgi:hypothetical protein